MLKQKANSLLRYCIRTHDWEPEPDSTSIIAFLKEASKRTEIKSKWDPQTAYSATLRTLSSYVNITQSDINEGLCDQFIKTFIRMLRRGMVNHFIVIPLPKASVKNLVEFDRFSFIPNDLPRKDKLEYLAAKTGSPLWRIEQMARHTESTRSPLFYEYALLCIKVRHHTQRIYNQARMIAMWNIAFLRAISIGFKARKSFNVAMSGYDDNNHLCVLSRQEWRSGHVTLLFNSSCQFELELFRRKEPQKKLVQLNKLLVFPASLDRLSFRFFRAFRLFSRSVDFIDTREPFEGLGLSSLFLMIATEGVLIEREAEKRARLSCLLTKLGCPVGVSRNKAYDTVNNCYKWRSDFVHSGTDLFPDYDEHYNKGEISNKMDLLREMVARLLLNCPKYIKFARNCAKQKLGSTKSLHKSDTERAWFQYIEECWNHSLAS